MTIRLTANSLQNFIIEYEPISEDSKRLHRTRLLHTALFYQSIFNDSNNNTIPKPRTKMKYSHIYEFILKTANLIFLSKSRIVLKYCLFV